jgi:hypothetical protein
VPRERPLRGLQKPTRVAHKYVRRRHAVQPVENRLNLAKPFSRISVALVPDTQAEKFKLSQNENGVDRFGECEAAISARPPMMVPVRVGTKHQFDRVELMALSLEQYGFEPVGDMRCSQLSLELRDGPWNSCPVEEARVKESRKSRLVAVPPRGLVLDVQQMSVDVVGDPGAMVEPCRQER